MEERAKALSGIGRARWARLGIPLLLAVTLTLPTSLPLGAVLNVIAGAVFLALAGLLLRIDFGNRVHRAFALFLTLRALLNLLTVFNTTPETSWFWTGTHHYFTLGLPFATLFFVATYLDAGRPSPRLRWVGRAALAIGLVVEVAYLLDHRLTWVENSAHGPLAPVAGLVVSGYLLAACVFLRAYTRAAARDNPSLLVMAVGFAAYGVDHHVTRTITGIYATEAPVESLLLVVLSTEVAWLLLRGNASQRMATKRWGLLLLAAAGTGLLPAVGDPLSLRLLAGPGWTLAAGLIVTYALLRHQLFDIDLRVKGTIKQSTVVAAFVGVYLVAAQGTQAWLGGTAPYIGIAVAALLGLFIAPLQRAAGKVADAAMPNVSDSPGYLSVRKLEVYRAALEHELASGSEGLSSPRLASLRARLGLTDRDHAVLLHAMRVEADMKVASGLESGDLVLGRYKVQAFLGEGAHGRTYTATDMEQGGTVVVKALRPERASESQLVREAKALAAVRHPNVVRLLDVAKDRGHVVLVLEFVDGGSLRARMDGGPMRGAAFRDLATGLLAGLSTVHASGAVHRDVKPSNVLLTRDGVPKLADFGIAHLPGAETTIGPKDSGTALGTIRYMSPEQAKGRKVTPRSDLFSAAATLYEAYTSEPHLPSKPGESPIELQMRAAAAGPFRRPVEGPAALKAWFAKALDPDPAARFSSASEMREALERALPTEFLQEETS